MVKIVDWAGNEVYPGRTFRDVATAWDFLTADQQQRHPAATEEELDAILGEFETEELKGFHPEGDSVAHGQGEKMDWKQGAYGCSARVGGGVAELSVTAYAKKPVVVNGISYGRSDMRAYEAKGNLFWKAKVRCFQHFEVGKYNTKEEAMAACLAKWSELLASLGRDN